MSVRDTAKAATDMDLLELAIDHAGGVPNLAALCGVKANTPNEWLRRLREGRSLSADKRRMFRELLRIEEHADVPGYTLSAIAHNPSRVALMSKRERAEALEQLGRALLALSAAEAPDSAKALPEAESVRRSQRRAGDTKR